LRLIESLFVDGPAGRLEALLEEPEDGVPKRAALVCHPHPKFGGTMHNKVVYRLARGLRATGTVVLRFNFRGVNLSEGEFDGGVGELEDARAALSVLRERYPNLPWLIAGFSFGSRIAMRLGCGSDAEKIVVVGFPTRAGEREMYSACANRRVFIQSTHDEHGPVPEMQAFYDTASGERELIWVEAEDHFFRGGLDSLEAVVQRISMQSA